MSYRDSPLNSLLSNNTFNLYSQTISTTALEYTKLPTTNWFLIYSPTTAEIVNILVRTPDNKLIQLLDNAGSFSSNANNYDISGMPRVVAYLEGSNYKIFVKSVVDTTIEPVYTDVSQSLVDYGSGSYPTGYTSSTDYDTLDTAGFSTSDRFYLYNTSESLSSSTGALIVAGGVGVGSVYTGTGGITTSNNTGGFSHIYTDSNGYLNMASSSNGMIITSSNLQFKVQRTDDLNITTLSNAPTYCAGAISSLAKIGCKDGLYVNPTGTSSAYGAMTYSSGQTSTEISTMNGGLTVRSPPNYAMFLNGKQTNATFTKSTYGGVATTSGSVAVDTGYLWLNQSGASSSSVRYNTGALVDNGLTGSVSFYFKTNSNYSYPPTNSVNIMYLYGSSVNADIIKLYHMTTGYLKLQCMDITRTELFDVNLDVFSPIADTPYFISVDWDLTNGSTKVFVNGTQLGATITAVGVRDSGRYISMVCPQTAAYGISFLRVYNDLTYTSTYTPPVITNYNLVDFPYDGGVKIYNNTNNTAVCELTSGEDGALIVNGTEVFGYFDPSTIITFSNTSQSTSTDTGGIIISGGLGIAKDLYVGGISHLANLNIETATIYNSLGGNDGTLTNDGNGYLLLSSQNGSKIKTITYYQWYAGLTASVNADYSAVGSSLTATTAGDVAIDSGMLMIGTTASSSVYWANAAGVDGLTTGCINLKYMPLYNSTPADTVSIIQFVNSSGNVNKLQLYHLASGSLKFQLYDSVGSSIGDITFGTWNPTSGTLYELEINWANNDTKLFIDGAQYGATNTTFDWSARTGVPTRIRSAIGSTGGSQYKIGQVQIFTTPQHTSAYTPFLPFGDIAVFSASGVNITNTTNSTNITTGSLTIAGGLGVAKDIFINGVMNELNTTNATSASTGSVILSGGLGIAKDLYISGVIKELNTTQSTSTDTGALIVSGGLGVAKDLFVQSNINIKNGTYTFNSNLDASGKLTLSNTNREIYINDLCNDLQMLQGVKTAAGTAQMADFYSIDSVQIQQLEFQKAAQNYIYFNSQVPHTWKAESTVYPHLHIATTTNMGTDTANFRITWEIKDINAVYTGVVATSTAYNDTIEVTGKEALKHCVVGFASHALTGVVGPSPIIVGKLERENSGTFAGSIFLIGFDFHIIHDKLAGDDFI